MAPQGVDIGVIGMEVEEAIGANVAVWVEIGRGVGVTCREFPGIAQPDKLIITTMSENNNIGFIRVPLLNRPVITDLARSARYCSWNWKLTAKNNW